MDREQRGNSRTPHNVNGVCPCRLPASPATTEAASSRRSSAAGTGWSRSGTPLATIEASRMASPAQTDSATATPRIPQWRTASWASGYPQALSPRTIAPAVRLIAQGSLATGQAHSRPPGIGPSGGTSSPLQVPLRPRNIGPRVPQPRGSPAVSHRAAGHRESGAQPGIGAGCGPAPVDGGTIRGGMETLVPARYQAPGLPS